MRNTYTRAEAIVQNCKDCLYDSKVTGTWRAQVQACTIQDCPFWDFRPLTAEGQKERASSKPRSEKQKANDKRLGQLKRS